MCKDEGVVNRKQATKGERERERTRMVGYTI